MEISLASSIPGKDDDGRDVSDESDDADEDEEHALDVERPGHRAGLKQEENIRVKVI